MRNTAQYILKRLLYMIPMVLVITFLIYGGLELTPGAVSYTHLTLPTIYSV